jgi:hypothetical protein
MVASAALLLGSLGRPAHGQSRQETLVIARNIDDYTTNDPGRQYEFTGQMLNQSVYDTLVTVDAPDFTRVQPKLATKWDVSKDGTVYTFTLRPDVKFTSGNPLTASDVRFSFRRPHEPSLTERPPGAAGGVIVAAPDQDECDHARGRQCQCDSSLFHSQLLCMISDAASTACALASSLSSMAVLRYSRGRPGALPRGGGPGAAVPRFVRTGP